MVKEAKWRKRRGRAATTAARANLNGKIGAAPCRKQLNPLKRFGCAPITRAGCDGFYGGRLLPQYHSRLPYWAESRVQRYAKYRYLRYLRYQAIITHCYSRTAAVESVNCFSFNDLQSTPRTGTAVVSVDLRGCTVHNLYLRRCYGHQALGSPSASTGSSVVGGHCSAFTLCGGGGGWWWLVRNPEYGVIGNNTQNQHNNQNQHHQQPISQSPPVSLSSMNPSCHIRRRPECQTTGAAPTSPRPPPPDQTKNKLIIKNPLLLTVHKVLVVPGRIIATTGPNRRSLSCVRSTILQQQHHPPNQALSALPGPPPNPARSPTTPLHQTKSV